MSSEIVHTGIPVGRDTSVCVKPLLSIDWANARGSYTNVHVLTKGGKEIHQTFNRKIAGAIAHQSRNMGLLDAKVAGVEAHITKAILSFLQLFARQHHGYLFGCRSLVWLAIRRNIDWHVILFWPSSWP